MSELPLKSKMAAFGAAIAIVGLVFAYVQEFAVFSNTIGVRKLTGGALVLALLLASLSIFLIRRRVRPFHQYRPAIMMAVFPLVLLAPLLGSWFNRMAGRNETDAFEFVSEKAYFASGGGFLKGERLEPSYYLLTVRENGTELRFKYKKQAYYPLTKPRETILLPVKKGLLGFRVVQLK